MALIGARTRISARPNLVTLERPGDQVSDGVAGWVETPVPLVPPTWQCAIQPATARDLEQLAPAGAVVSQNTYVFAGPYRGDITSQTVIKLGTRVFYVNGVHTPDERQVDTVLLCTEQTA
jgi:head-tail adaptor